MMTVKNALGINPLSFIVIFMCSAGGRAEESDSFLSCKNSIYVVEYTFTTNCREDMLLEIFYEFSHLKEFVTKKHTTVTQLENSENWYKVQYDYRFLIYTSRSIFKRIIVPEENLVEFEMLDFSHSINIIPKTLASSGYYKIERDEQGNTVTYYQESILDRPLGGLYLRILKGQIKKFLHDFESYVKKFEKGNDFNAEDSSGLKER